MKYQGKELSYYSSTFLAKQLGMLNTVKWIFFGIFVVGSLVFGLGGLSEGSLLIALGGPVFCFAICGFPMIYAFRMSKAILMELDDRTLTHSQRAEIQAQIRKAAKFQLYLTVAGIAILAILFGAVIADSIPSRSSYGCTICGKTATNTFQNSRYCQQHYEDAIIWAMDNVSN